MAKVTPVYGTTNIWLAWTTLTSNTDQLIAPYDAKRKTLKWHRKLAVHLLQLVMVNAFTLYKKSHPTARFLKFQTDVISSLVFDVALEPDTTKSEELARLTERDLLSHTPETAKGSRKNFLTRRCRVCHKNGVRKEVTYVCDQYSSHPALCPVPCYHTINLEVALLHMQSLTD